MHVRGLTVGINLDLIQVWNIPTNGFAKEGNAIDCGVRLLSLSSFSVT